MPTEPWTSYPAEVNAARLAGPGPASWFTAAAIWAAQGAQAAQAQATFLGQVATQSGISQGTTTMAVEAKATPFSAWLSYMELEALQMATANMIVGTAYVTAMAATVPLPAILANRASAKVAQAAAAVDASMAPVSVQLEQVYAEMTAQNGLAMTTYDTSVSTASTPKVFSPPPRLVDSLPSGAYAPLPEPNPKRMNQSLQQGQNMLQQGLPTAQQAAGQASQFATQTAPVSQAGMGAANARQASVGSYMNQLSRPLSSGTLRNGLGSGSHSLAAPRHLGGFPGASGMAGGLPVGALATMSAAAPLSAATPAGMPVGAKPGFTGIPPEARAASTASGRTPLGAMPGANSPKRDNKQAKANAIEEITVFDPFAAEAKQRKEAQLFR